MTTRPADDDVISLRPPDVEAVSRVPTSSDVAHAHEEWLARAAVRDDTHYFSIYRGDELVGQIVLHDINRQSGEALVAYHLFTPRFRGRGIGTRALALVQHIAVTEMMLKHVVIITAEDNYASRRMAEKCGFRCTGRARENARWLVYRWDAMPATPRT